MKQSITINYPNNKIMTTYFESDYFFIGRRWYDWDNFCWLEVAEMSGDKKEIYLELI